MSNDSVPWKRCVVQSTVVDDRGVSGAGLSFPLDDGLRSQFDQGIARRLLSDRDAVPCLTLPKAIAEPDAMMDDADAASIGALSEIREYLEERLEWAKGTLH